MKAEHCDIKTVQYRTAWSIQKQQPLV